MFCTGVRLGSLDGKSRLGLARVEMDQWLADDEADCRSHMADSYHHIGTTRMGVDEGHGVVRQQLPRVWNPRALCSGKLRLSDLRVRESYPEDRRPVITACPPYCRVCGNAPPASRQGRPGPGWNSTNGLLAGWIAQNLEHSSPLASVVCWWGSLAFKKGCSHGPGKYR
jgi:hypothetical protein